jgi:hypothetical protein
MCCRTRRPLSLNPALARSGLKSSGGCASQHMYHHCFTGYMPPGLQLVSVPLEQEHDTLPGQDPGSRLHPLRKQCAHVGL